MSAPLPPASAYIVQFIRAVRFLRRLDQRSAPDLEAAVRAMQEYDDDLYAFIVTCWHVRDWVTHDDTIPQPIRDGVSDAAFASDLLKACHDIANGDKHYTLDRPKLPGPVKRGPVTVKQGSPTTWEFTLVLPDGVSRKAHEFARDALEEWRRIFGANRLAAPEIW